MPGFELFFSGNSDFEIVIGFKVDQFIDVILLSKTFDQMISM